jgi:hypothetical protein
MARQPTPLKTTQEEPTQAPPRDKAGFELDEHGLPRSGPERAARLEDLGIEDPALSVEADAEIEAKTAAAPLTDQNKKDVTNG